MAFVKGQSGNPGGRAPKTEAQINFEKKCREWADKHAFAKLATIADSDDVKASQWAVKELLDRAFGKSVETSIVDANVATTTGSSIEELAGEFGVFISGATPTTIGNSIQAPVDGGK